MILGSYGESCDRVCTNAGLACSTSEGRFPQQLSQSVTAALFQDSGYSCPSWSYGNDGRLPMRYRYTGGGCERNTGMSYCHGSDNNYQRLCACSEDHPSDSDAGGLGCVCIECPVGKYLPTEGSANATDCVPCGRGKYSAERGATSEGTCRDCGAGKYAATEGNVQDSDCIPCKRGTFSNATGALAEDTRMECSAGKYAAAEGVRKSGV